MILLKDILYKVPLQSVLGSTQVSIASLQFDSRNVALNDVFIALKGSAVDGHEYIDQATKNGALVIVCESLPKKIINGVTYVEVTDSHQSLALLSANYFDHPSKKISLVGITGTNGKTTVASLLFQLFQQLGHSVGLISTVAIKINDQKYPSTHTTPNSIDIQHYLQKMVESGVAYCFMEVSSHGIHQKRIEGLEFSGGIFTNLSHDHLDYHDTFKAYRDVKKSFFDQLPKSAFALSNADDKNGKVMLQNTAAKKTYYALKSIADYKGQILENQFSGMLLKVNHQEVWSRLIGTFNAYNILAVYAASQLLHCNAMEVLQILSVLRPVDGRFEYIVSNDNITAVIDYAHTPDALKNVLTTINQLRTGNETLITVIGCGGNRDVQKRPIMAHIAATLSNKVILTSDNPRNEDPQKIINEMEAGINPVDYKKSVSILDREQAIKTACQFASKNDIILIAGKGHETYQEIEGVRHDFDDLKIVTQLLKRT